MEVENNIDKPKYDFGSTEREQSVIDMESVIKRIVEERVGDINRITENIQSWLKDDTKELSDQEIEDILLQLPIVLYNVIEDQELVGMQSDMANQLYKEAQSEAFRLARGTIADKNAISDLQTRAQQLEKIIYDRSYKIVKQRIDIAIEALNAVKRVQSSRQQKADLATRRF